MQGCAASLEITGRTKCGVQTLEHAQKMRQLFAEKGGLQTLSWIDTYHAKVAKQREISAARRLTAAPTTSTA